MKRILTILLFLCCAGTNSPDIMMAFLSPTNGTIVSNTVALSVNASSSTTNIVYVKWFRDGVLIDRTFAKLQAPVIDKIQ